MHDLWTENWGVPLCKCAMSRNRFCKILRFLCFEVKSNRSHRLQIEKFPLFSEVRTHFTDNCCALYKPGAFITVDEQHFLSKARCPFTKYIASKPDKFEQKYWLAVGKESKCVINGFPYVGKDEMRSSTERVSDCVVMQLMRLYLGKWRNVTTDSHFTSVKLANQLKENQTKSFGNSKQNQERSAITIEKNERRFSFLQAIQIWRYYSNCIPGKGE